MSKAVLDKLIVVNDAVSREVDSELRRVLSRINFGDPLAAREALFTAIPPLIERWGDVAGTAAAEWFEEFRDSQGASGSFSAQLADSVPPEVINARLGYATRETGHLFRGEITELGKFVSLITNEYVLKPGHDTIMYNAKRDKVAYARVPEPGACKWCLMLASRGFAYSSKASAKTKDGERFHGHCRCHAMPVYDETRARVEYGYNPERFYEEYLAAE